MKKHIILLFLIGLLAACSGNLKRNDIVTINGTQDTVKCFCRVQWIEPNGNIKLHCKDGSTYYAADSVLTKCDVNFNYKDFEWND